MSEYHGEKEQSRVCDEKISEQEKLAFMTASASWLELKEVLREGLMSFCTAVGMTVFHQMLEEEVTALAGPKGKHDKERTHYRHGTEAGSVTLGGRKLPIQRPRVRSVDGQEARLEVYEMAHDHNALLEAAVSRMLHGLSSRNYQHGLEPAVGENEAVIGTSKSSVSRQFVKATQAHLQQLLSRRFDNVDIPVVLIDGVQFTEDYHVLVAMGITIDGRKLILGIRLGSTENATVCKDLLVDLQARGLHADSGLLAIIDGSKALRSALKSVFGDKVLVQRCQVHKLRNVLDYLPPQRREWVKRKMRQAWAMDNADEAIKALKQLATALEKEYPDAASSLHEGMEETVTVLRLQISGRLRKSLRSTNSIESLNSMLRRTTRNVKNWKNGAMVQRWVAAGLLEAEGHFRRIQGYKELPQLKAEIARLTMTASESTMGENTRKTA